MNARQPRMMIFVSLTRGQARSIRSDGSTDEDLDAFAATGEMITAHGYAPTEREDADYAALQYASISGLRRSDDYARLVVSAEVPISRVSDGSDASYGAIRVHGLNWKDVTAVFVDESESASAVQSARQAILEASDGSEPELEPILGLPDVISLSDDYDLLWHHPDEDW